MTIRTIEQRARSFGIVMTAAQRETERLIGEAAKGFAFASPDKRADAWAHTIRLTKLRDPGFLKKLETAEREWLDVEFANLRAEAAQARDDFYRSRPWRALRYRALVRHGNRCQCCGAGAVTGAILHVDHIRPLARYPELALVLDNLQVLCADCNRGKGSHDETDWRPAA